ncbi:MAG: sigma-54-dependent Fis family transcriptional regulator [Deltaproteobacteria bacterium]|nr:sigma-54-dependent Fis family transcriptional regulator [Deltaproteobacteria bacterium]
MALARLPTVLVVEDDDDLRAMLARSVGAAGYGVLEAADGEEALGLLASHAVGCVLSDVCMPGISGLTLLDRIHARDPGLPVLLLTAHGALEDAVEALHRGAWDYLPKPVRREDLVAALQRVLEAPEEGPRASSAGEALGAGRSPAMVALYGRMARAAAVDLPVLLVGETGTGKEWAARAIHRLSARRRGPFVAVHGAALAPGTLESELFGHTRGSYTGASEARRGLFQRAHGGVLLLDEVADLPRTVQAELLRVLERGEVRPLGSDRVLTVDVRVLATTRRELPALVASGALRRDLYHRLRVLELRVPPLRDRPGDITPLAEHFLRATGSPRRFAPATLEALAQRTFPGNVRELRGVVESAAALGRGPLLHPEDLPAPAPDAPPAPEDAPAEDPLHTVREALGACLSRDLPSLDTLARSYARAVLARFQGNRTEASRALGIDRKTLRRLLGAG